MSDSSDENSRRQRSRKSQALAAPPPPAPVPPSAAFPPPLGGGSARDPKAQLDAAVREWLTLEADSARTDREKRDAQIRNYLTYRSWGGLRSEPLRAEIDDRKLRHNQTRPPAYEQHFFLQLFRPLDRAAAKGQKAWEDRRKTFSRDVALWAALDYVFPDATGLAAETIIEWVDARGGIDKAVRWFRKERQATPAKDPRGDVAGAEEPVDQRLHPVDEAIAGDDAPLELDAPPELLEQLPDEFVPVVRKHGGRLRIHRVLKDFPDGARPYADFRRPPSRNIDPLLAIIADVLERGADMIPEGLSALPLSPGADPSAESTEFAPSNRHFRLRAEDGLMVVSAARVPAGPVLHAAAKQGLGTFGRPRGDLFLDVGMRGRFERTVLRDRGDYRYGGTAQTDVPGRGEELVLTFVNKATKELAKLTFKSIARLGSSPTLDMWLLDVDGGYAPGAWHGLSGEQLRRVVDAYPAAQRPPKIQDRRTVRVGLGGASMSLALGTGSPLELQVEGEGGATAPIDVFAEDVFRVVRAIHVAAPGTSTRWRVDAEGLLEVAFDTQHVSYSAMVPAVIGEGKAAVRNPKLLSKIRRTRPQAFPQGQP